jgi:hypothetical protein
MITGTKDGVLSDQIQAQTNCFSKSTTGSLQPGLKPVFALRLRAGRRYPEFWILMFLHHRLLVKFSSNKLLLKINHWLFAAGIEAIS